MGKGVIDERDSLFLGNATLSSGDFVHRAVAAADLIVNIGHDVVEKPPFFMEDGGVEVIHVNFSTAAVDPVYFPQVEVVGDIANSIWQICEGLEKQDHWDFSRFDEVRRAGEAHVLEGADDSRFPVYPQRLVADTRQVMDSRDIIALDNGIYKIWFARNYKAHSTEHRSCWITLLATMGAGFAFWHRFTAWYSQIGKVLSICGDGGFMMNSQELETAVRLEMDLVVLILRDDAYGMIRWKQAARFTSV